MKNKAYLKQSAAEKYDIKEASNQNLSAKERRDYARNAQFDSKSFEQKMDGDMGSFDVMSEPQPLMSRSANKVNHIAAGRSKFMQAEKPKEFKIDRQATNAANMEILKDNQAISASNTANRAEARRLNAAAAIDFAKNKRAVEEANKGIDEKNRIEAERQKIENQKSNLKQYNNPQNPSSKKKKNKKQKNKGGKANVFSGFAGDRKKKN